MERSLFGGRLYVHHVRRQNRASLTSQTLYHSPGNSAASLIILLWYGDTASTIFMGRHVSNTSSRTGHTGSLLPVLHDLIRCRAEEY